MHGRTARASIEWVRTAGNDESPAEVGDDPAGPYIEVIGRHAFDGVLAKGLRGIAVFYNHGYTINGTPSDLGSVPIGRPLEIKPDARGLRTVSRFNRSDLADSVLAAIRNGDIRGYSFRGKIYRSNPPRVPRGRGDTMPTIRRLELELDEYARLIDTPKAFTDRWFTEMMSERGS
jgi:phage head maturation protease